MDRGIIKWQPFNSCFVYYEIIKDIEIEKDRLAFPKLSEDQINNLEYKIIKSYSLRLIVNIEYYYVGNINSIEEKIEYLDKKGKKLYLNNKKIYFKQILKIREF